MTKTIVLASAKGGAGKTTTALNLAVALAEKAYPTLLVDLDPQGAVGLSLARSDTEWVGVAELVTENSSFEEAVIQTKLPGLHILPRGRLDPADVREYERAIETPGIVEDRIIGKATDYKYIITDTPAGMGTVVQAALGVAQYVVVPLQSEPLALRSLGQTLRVIDCVRERANPHLELLGILATMVTKDYQFSRNVLATMWSGFGAILETTIPRAEIFGTASEEGLPVSFLPGPFPKEARLFEMLATELEDLIEQMDGEIGVSDERPRRELI